MWIKYSFRVSGGMFDQGQVDLCAYQEKLRIEEKLNNSNTLNNSWTSNPKPWKPEIAGNTKNTNY